VSVRRAAKAGKTTVSCSAVGSDDAPGPMKK
jgi:hypothetical protein